MMQLLLLLLLLALKTSESFNLHHYLPDNLLSHKSQNQSLQQLHRELALYVHQHSRDAILSDGPRMCNRTYAIAIYNAPEQIGNHMHEFLNNFIGAYVTNRTVLWHYCDRKPCRWNPLEYCGTLLHRSPWIMHYAEMQQLWAQYGCEGDSNAAQFTQMGHRPVGEEIVMCCGIDRLVARNIYFGTNEQHEYFAAALPNAALLPHNHQRARNLFQLGEHTAYGILFRLAFKFTNQIVKDNVDLLRNHIQSLQRDHHHFNHQAALSVVSEDEPFYVSIHLRHSAIDDNINPVVEQDELALSCFKQTKQDFLHIMKGKLCVILLAADRNETLQYWFNRQHEVGCSVVVSNHSDQHGQFTEHGPYTGEIAVRDIELLSRGDLFIGSTYQLQGYKVWASSFSMLIAELRSVNGRQTSLNIPPRFIPECGDVLGGRRVPKQMFTDQTTSCIRSQMKGVFLPEMCPLGIDENK